MSRREYPECVPSPRADVCPSYQTDRPTDRREEWLVLLGQWFLISHPLPSYFHGRCQRAILGEVTCLRSHRVEVTLGPEPCPVTTFPHASPSQPPFSFSLLSRVSSEFPFTPYEASQRHDSHHVL